MLEEKAPQSIDFEAEGFISGLEFHQQLKAPYQGVTDEITLREGSKLFCPCPCYMREDEPDITVIRQFRALSGETGTVDIAARFEQLKKNNIKFEAYHDTTCLVELDEEPIRPINENALFRSLAIAKNVFKLELVDEIHVNRKTIVDGSNTSGFQRTAQIAYGTENSVLNIGDLKIRIMQANLEEDSAKNMGKDGDYKVFRLDRLGIPLIEIATGPDMRNPTQVKQVAQRIGTLLRLTNFVRRGLGTIRQDLNVSIKKGARVEIKGVQQLDLIETYAKNEAIRQYRMNQFITHLKNTLNFTEKDLTQIEPIDVTKHFKKTQAKLIQKAMKRKEQVIAAKFPKFNGLFKYELQPNYRIGTELSEIGKVIAGIGGILHSDELPKLGIKENELNAVKKDLQIKENDGYILIITKQENAQRAITAMKDVMKLWLQGLPREVRAPRADGTTGFLRPLPGGARMYPETDAPPIPITKELLEKINNTKFETPEERLQRYQKDYKLSKQFAEQLITHHKAQLFEEIVQKNYDPKAAAKLILQTMVELRRENVNIDAINEQELITALLYFKEKNISDDNIPELLKILAKKKPNENLNTILKNNFSEAMSTDEAKQIIHELLKEKTDFIKTKQLAAVGPLMGVVMPKLKGKLPGKIISQLVKEEIQKVIKQS